MAFSETLNNKNPNETSEKSIEVLILELELEIKQAPQTLAEIDEEIEAMQTELKRRKNEAVAVTPLEEEAEEQIKNLKGKKDEKDKSQKIIDDVIDLADKNKSISRRKFLNIAGGTVAAAGVVGAIYELASNTNKKQPEKEAGPTVDSPKIDNSRDTIKQEVTKTDTVATEQPKDTVAIKQEIPEKIDTVKSKEEIKKQAEQEIIAKQKEKFGKLYEKMDMHFYNDVLDDEGRLVYLFRITNQQEQKEHPGYWLMLDKKTTKLHIVDGGNKLAHSRTVLIGKETGEELNDEDKLDGHLSTPAAYTVISNENISDFYKNKYGQNLWRVENSGAFEDEGIYIHGLIGEAGEREALASKDKKAHRKSHGCIRDPNIVEDQKHWHAGKTRLAIMPENKGLILNPETGKTEACKGTDLKKRIEEVIDKNK